MILSCPRCHPCPPLPPLILFPRYNEDVELEDAIHIAILTLKEGFEGKMTEDNVEVSVLGKDGGFKVGSAIFSPFRILRLPTLD